MDGPKRIGEIDGASGLKFGGWKLKKTPLPRCSMDSSGGGCAQGVPNFSIPRVFPVKKGSLRFPQIITYPDAQCMVYLPTFTHP